MNQMHGEQISSHPEFVALRRLSARIGADPLLIQAAGGNTSIKIDETLWIKASGTWLSEAESRDVFVPVELAPLRDALDSGDPEAETAIVFVPEDRNPRRLRPSIETTVHAVFPQRVVVHAHCVNTIAVAVRQDAEADLERRLGGLDWAFVPYRRPGAPLARAIGERLRRGTDVVILGNHGLIVAAESVAEADDLLADVVSRLTTTPVEMRVPDLDALRIMADGSGYGPVDDIATHQAALTDRTCEAACRGSLYPDHVIFLGEGAYAVDHGEAMDVALERILPGERPDPVILLVPGKGVLIRGDATSGARAMARCLSDVLRRVPGATRLNYLSGSQNHELLNWDAEKYRQALNAD